MNLESSAASILRYAAAAAAFRGTKSGRPSNALTETVWRTRPKSDHILGEITERPVASTEVSVGAPTVHSKRQRLMFAAQLAARFRLARTVCSRPAQRTKVALAAVGGISAKTASGRRLRMKSAGACGMSIFDVKPRRSGGHIGRVPGAVTVSRIGSFDLRKARVSLGPNGKAKQALRFSCGWKACITVDGRKLRRYAVPGPNGWAMPHLNHLRSKCRRGRSASDGSP